MILRTAIVSVLAAAATVIPAVGPASAAVACPLVYGHGGYPTNGTPYNLDQVRQPNHPKGLADQAGWGADGVEADVQLTKDGTKAVMWHNTGTGKLTGSTANVNTLWWATGADKLSGRTIEVGPYKGQTVYTLREFLNAAKTNGLNVYLEVKTEAAQSLLNADATIKANAWTELLDPVQERYTGQVITMYSSNTSIAAELSTRATARGLGSVLTNRPKWTDSVPWEEPALPAADNHAQWASILATGPARVFTSYPREYRIWLNGQSCTA